MTRHVALVAAVLLVFGFARANAGVVVTVDQAAQRISVAVDGITRYDWPVSTARWGYVTPNGTYKPQWLAKQWYSTIYDNAPMPYSIFFYSGFAIHGTTDYAHLGQPASHGCVRLHPEDAALLFELVKDNMKDTSIIVTGERPQPPKLLVSERGAAPQQPAEEFTGLFGRKRNTHEANNSLSYQHWMNR